MVCKKKLIILFFFPRRIPESSAVDHASDSDRFSTETVQVEETAKGGRYGKPEQPGVRRRHSGDGKAKAIGEEAAGEATGRSAPKPRNSAGRGRFRGQSADESVR